MKLEIEFPPKWVIGSLTQAYNKLSIWYVILISAVLRFFVMPFPNDGGMIFDEAHYVPASLSLLKGIAANAEHPPLTKLMVAASIKVFGDFWFAWRFPIVITALISTYLVYVIAKKFVNEKYAVLTAFFMIFDIIFFIHGNIYLLEMPSLMFALASVALLLNNRINWSGAMMGFAFLANEKALFVLGAMALYSLFKFSKKSLNMKLIKRVGAFILIAVLIAGMGLWICDAIWRPASKTVVSNMIRNTVIQDENGTAIRTETATEVKTAYEYISDPVSHLRFMWDYYTGINTNLQTPAVDFRPPWSWITPFGSDTFNHANYLVTVVQMGDLKDYIINYRAQIPITIWFMTIPILGISILHIRKDNFAKFFIAWVTATYLPWLISDLSKQNMTFIHYFLFTIPAVCIGIPWFWNKLIPEKHLVRNIIIIAHLAATVVFFFVFFPVGLVRTF